MPTPISGIHHITAITADAQKNVDFYTGVLGLRLVKLTVNFDDPSSYHLYYGDEHGSPGTILTFFAWPSAYRGRIAASQVSTTAFAIPAGSVKFWSQRLSERKVGAITEKEVFGQRSLAFVDPDGMQLELVASEQSNPQRTWSRGGVSAEHAIRGFHGATLSEEGYEHTARLLTETMGLKAGANEGNRFRYSMTDGTIIDLLCVPDGRHGNLGAGIVHHIAYRAANDADQLEWRRTLTASGSNVSPVMDRNYFHSIYYREPGGVLFEIATDGPGFDGDEPLPQLGTKLKLPAQYEVHRAEIEAVLPKLKLPGV